MKICLDDILMEVSNYYGFPRGKILEKTRKKTTINLRHMSVFLAKQLTEHSLSEIAEFFHYEDHKSVSHCVKSISKRFNTDRGHLVYDYNVIVHNLSTA